MGNWTVANRVAFSSVSKAQNPPTELLWVPLSHVLWSRAGWIFRVGFIARQSEKSTASRKKMVQAAGAAFRDYGLGGIGVDGLAKAADFTSGAFYFHFKSKLDAFVAGLEDSLDDLNARIQGFQATEGSLWVAAFARFYLGFKRTCELGGACSVPVLSSEAERAGLAARQAGTISARG